MIYLIIHVLALVAFGQSLRLGQKRFGKIIGISAVNYTVGAIISLVIAGAAFRQSGAEIQWPLVTIGFANGILYFLCLVVMLIGYDVVGVGITSALVSCGMVLPILAAWLLGWEPALTIMQGLALVLLAPALWLMRPQSQTPQKIDWQGNLLLLTAFLMPGVMAILHIWAGRLAEDAVAGNAVYTTAIFFGACISTSVLAIRRREGVAGRALWLGTWIGIVNVLATLMLVLAVQKLGAAVFFSTGPPAVILLHLILSHLAWGERLVHRQLLGVGFALLVILLANIK